MLTLHTHTCLKEQNCGKCPREQQASLYYHNLRRGNETAVEAKPPVIHTAGKLSPSSKTSGGSGFSMRWWKQVYFPRNLRDDFIPLWLPAAISESHCDYDIKTKWRPNNTGQWQVDRHPVMMINYHVCSFVHWQAAWWEQLLQCFVWINTLHLSGALSLDTGSCWIVYKNPICKLWDTETQKSKRNITANNRRMDFCCFFFVHPLVFLNTCDKKAKSKQHFSILIYGICSVTSMVNIRFKERAFVPDLQFFNNHTSRKPS